MYANDGLLYKHRSHLKPSPVRMKIVGWIPYGPSLHYALLSLQHTSSSHALIVVGFTQTRYLWLYESLKVPV
jgi:hypothetical protein